MVDPSLLCRKHLMGEHVECHMFVGSIKKNRSLKGHILKDQVEIYKIRERHTILSSEMIKRGYNHKSDLPKFNDWVEGFVDSSLNLVELTKRCSNCRERILGKP